MHGYKQKHFSDDQTLPAIVKYTSKTSKKKKNQ